MNLNKLRGLLPYHWKIQAYTKNKTKAIMVAYIDARQARDMLDEEVGPENWQSQYEEHKGNLFCGIGVKCGEEWIWKWDVGTRGDIEADKAEASDAFKRACVQWGIGRFLYDFKPVYLTKAEYEANQYNPEALGKLCESRLSGKTKPPKEKATKKTTKKTEETNPRPIDVVDTAFFDFETTHKDEVPAHWIISKAKFLQVIEQRWGGLPTRIESIKQILDPEKGVQLADVLIEAA